MSPTTSLVQSSSLALLEPADIQEAIKFATNLAVAYEITAQVAFAKIQAGRSMGMSAFESMQNIYFIKGRATLAAQFMESRILGNMTAPEGQRVVDAFEMREITEEKCVYYAKRIGRPGREYEFTIAEARRANLIKAGGNWEMYPKRMLQARARSYAAQSEFPDLINGMPSYEDMQEENSKPLKVQGPQQGPIPQAPPSDKIPDAEVVEEPKQASPVAGAIRDYASELEDLKIKIAKAEAGKQVRAMVQKFVSEAGEPWATDAKAAYNSKFAAAAKPAPASEPAAASEEAAQ